jgi:hypothetical protein
MTRQTFWLWRQLSKPEISRENLARLAAFLGCGARSKLEKLPRDRLERAVVLALVYDDLHPLGG